MIYLTCRFKMTNITHITHIAYISKYNTYMNIKIKHYVLSYQNS